MVIFNSEPFCYLSATFYRHHRDHVQLAITLATPVKSHCITMATSCCPPMRMPSPCRAVRMWAAVAWQRNIYPTLAFGTQQWWRLRTTTTTITTIKRTAITVAATTLTWTINYMANIIMPKRKSTRHTRTSNTCHKTMWEAIIINKARIPRIVRSNIDFWIFWFGVEVLVFTRR